ncbi:hypothetical protein QF038_001814 [Pseudarthrobacter sp. W1I19]|uniref:hypothetical protein n=1 Tax=Pseudarthrobacter sp. W1I19 TaxID=3042288 RepID=UPI00277F6D83|nr:hypothetical protein [Pseudarthrobacter sp. W1I19]MDQ0923306.1 hypothetical protein [Pseudarthrobacter sp. W1I19]
MAQPTKVPVHYSSAYRLYGKKYYQNRDTGLIEAGKGHRFLRALAAFALIFVMAFAVITAALFTN